jgi:hypothetical protein
MYKAKFLDGTLQELLVMYVVVNEHDDICEACSCELHAAQLAARSKGLRVVRVREWPEGEK